MRMGLAASNVATGLLRQASCLRTSSWMNVASPDSGLRQALEEPGREGILLTIDPVSEIWGAGSGERGSTAVVVVVDVEGGEVTGMGDVNAPGYWDTRTPGMRNGQRRAPLSSGDWDTTVSLRLRTSLQDQRTQDSLTFAMQSAAK